MTLLFIILLFNQTAVEQLFELDSDLPEELPQKEVLEQLMKHPLDLNRASRDELLQIPFLDPVLVDRMIRYRQKSDFRHIEDLIKISGFGSGLVDMLAPFVTVRLAVQGKKPPVKKKLGTRLRIVDKDFSFNDSFKNRSFYCRIGGEIGTCRLVVMTEKDSGETNYFDFLSTGFGFAADGHQAVAGNYFVTAGQGLVFSAPFGFISGPEFALDIGKGERLEPQTLASENSGLFGIAYRRIVGSWMPMVIVSSRKLDAAINPDGSVDHISPDGLHADSAGIAEKDQLSERLFGARLACKRKNWGIGVTGYANHYDRRFRPRDSTDSFYGDHLTVVGVDCAGILGDYFTFGEIGYSLANGGAGIVGLAGDLDRLKVGFSLRGYQQRFFSPHSRVGSLKDQRDKLEAHFTAGYRLKDFQLSFDGTTARDFVTDSMPTRFQLELEKREKRVEFGLTLKQSLKEDAPRSQGMKIDVAYTPWKFLALTARLEDRYAFERTVKRSLVVLGSCDWDFGAFDLTARFYKFGIGSSSTRIYAYEPGLPGLGGNHSFSGEGVRAFGLMSLTVRKRLRLAIKAGFTKTDSTTVDVGCQLELNY
jgi:hypothetical protein